MNDGVEGVEIGIAVELGIRVARGVGEMGVEPGLDVVCTNIELDVSELLWGGVDELGAAVTGKFRDGGCVAADSSSLSSSVPPSKTTKFALDPGGTVTTQKFAPPAPSETVCPSTSFTL